MTGRLPQQAMRFPPRPPGARRKPYPAAVARGRFWVIEGMDGSGKSTQAARLAASQRKAGRNLLSLREPGATPLGESLRALLLHAEGAAAAREPRAEALLFFAARVELLACRVGPALAAGEDVLCERFSASTLAYQGQSEADAAFVLELDRLCVPPDLQPDRVLILDLPAAESFARRKEAAARAGLGLDAIEARGLAFQERVRAGYRLYAEAHPQRCSLLPVAGLDADAVAARIRAALGLEAEE